MEGMEYDDDFDEDLNASDNNIDRDTQGDDQVKTKKPAEAKLTTI